MARLLLHPRGDDMLADHALCRRVVHWKSRVFARQWARYDLAVPGSFRLIPPLSRLDALRRDYARMQPMFLSTPPAFDELLAQLQAAEDRLNTMDRT